MSDDDCTGTPTFTSKLHGTSHGGTVVFTATCPDCGQTASAQMPEHALDGLPCRGEGEDDCYYDENPWEGD